jgi:hypothetical protein
VNAYDSRTVIWGRLDEALPDDLSVLRPALRRRVLASDHDPLRNRLIRKLVLGVYDQTNLIAWFRNVRVMVRNWEQFTNEIAQREGPDFDSRLWPWLAEVRALDLLRAERRAIAATVISGRPDQRTPDFLVHRPSGDGLAEVKSVTPNNNFDTLEQELEIAVIRTPDVFDRRLYGVRTPDDRDVILSAEPAALAALIECLRDAIDAGRDHVTYPWPTPDRKVAQVDVDIEPYPRFALAGDGVGGELDADFQNRWLSPFHQRLVDKGNEALTQMLDYEGRVGTLYPEKDVVIYYVEPGACVASLLLSERLTAIKTLVETSLRARDGGVALSVRS